MIVRLVVWFRVQINILYRYRIRVFVKILQLNTCARREIKNELTLRRSSENMYRFNEWRKRKKKLNFFRFITINEPSSPVQEKMIAWSEALNGEHSTVCLAVQLLFVYKVEFIYFSHKDCGHMWTAFISGYISHNPFTTCLLRVLINALSLSHCTLNTDVK